MLDKLSALFKNLLTVNCKDESYLLHILLKYAGYDDEWKQKVENSAGQNTRPFAHFFGGEQRIYIPFKPTSNMHVPIDSEVEGVIEAAGYEITDYIGGYCQKDNRTFKIGKILQKLRQDEIAQAKEIFKKEGGDYQKLEAETIEKINQKYNIINNVFINSAIRRNKQYLQDLQIVFSQDPHDLAKMSYERGWKSCMELGVGCNYEHVFSEVREGGFIAYLISGNDKEIKHPLARIHIRRFVGPNGINLAKAEETVYGNESPGFLEAVKAWVEDKNKQQLFEHEDLTGYYKRKGGEWSDTYGDILVIAPEKKEELIKWFREDLPNTEEITWVFTDNMYDELRDLDYWTIYQEYFDENYEGRQEFSTREGAESFKRFVENMDYDEEWINYFLPSDEQTTLEEEGRLDEAINELKNRRFDISFFSENYKEQLRFEAVERIIEKHITKQDTDLVIEILQYLQSKGSNFDYVSELYNSFPELLTDEAFLKINRRQQGLLLKKIEVTHPELGTHLFEIWKDIYKKLLDKDSPQFQLAVFNKSEGRESNQYDRDGSSVIGRIANIISQITNFRVDEEIYEHIKKLIFQDFESLPLYETNPITIRTYRKSLMKEVFYNLDAQILPDKVAIDIGNDFFSGVDLSALEYNYTRAISIHDWLYYIKNLKGNGMSFIPLLNDLLKTMHKDVLENESYQHMKLKAESTNNMSDYYKSELERMKETFKKEFKIRTERINFTLDCIQNDTDYSRKFKWYID